MKYIISLFLISFSISTILAQTPGYLGKRISIEGDLNLLPNFTNFALGNDLRQVYYKTKYYESYYNPSTNSYESIELVKFNAGRDEVKKPNHIRYTFKSSIALNYTISKNKDVSLRFNKIYCNLMYRSQSNSGVYNALYFNENIKYRSTEIDINFKFYKKNFIAPVGKYILFGFGLAKIKSNPNKITGTLVNSIYDYNTNRYTNSEEEVYFNNSVNYFKINFGLGNKTILANDVFLMYGIESNIYFIYNNSILNSDDDYITQFKRNYNNNLSKNLLWDNIFCI